MLLALHTTDSMWDNKQVVRHMPLTCLDIQASANLLGYHVPTEGGRWI